MDILKKLKFWRGLGKIVDTKIGSSISETSRLPINWMVSLIVSTNNDVVPWTPFKRPLAESSLAVVSTAGFYVEGDEPFDIDSVLGDASFRKIPSNVTHEKIKIAHPHYPHARVKQDINVLFPIDRLRELTEAKVIGKLATNFYSFGFGGNMTEEYIGESYGSAHQLAQKLLDDEVDYVIMVPAWPLCNWAGGLISRVLESNGIATVSLSINRQVSEKLLAPRAAFVKFPHGASFGEPNNRLQQMTILYELLLLLKTAEKPGILKELPYKWRRSTYEDLDWETFVDAQKNNVL